MNLFKKYFGKHKVAFLVCIFILIFQVLFTLVQPLLLGKLVGVGIEQKGIECSSPEVISPMGMTLMEEVLPEEKYEEFLSLYEKDDDNYALKDNVENEKANELYSNAVMCTIDLVLSENSSGKKISANRIKSMLSIITLRFFYVRLQELPEFTEEEKIKSYENAEETQQAVKGQLAAILAPYFYKDAGVDIEETQKDYINKNLTYMLIFALLQVVCVIINGIIAARVSSRISKEMRKDFLLHTSKFTKEQTLSCTENLFDVFSVDIGNVERLVEYAVGSFIYAPILCISGTILSFMISPVLGLIVLATVLAALVVLFVLFKVAMPRFEKLQKLYHTFNKFVKSSVAQVYTIRTLNAEKHERTRLLTISGAVKKTEKFVLKALFTALSVISLISNFVMAVIVLVGGESLLNSTLYISDIIAFLHCSILTVSAFMIFGAMVIFAPKAKVSFRKFKEIMLIETPDFYEKDGIILDENKAHEIEFRNVSLGEKTRVDLKNVSFTAEAGKITAIVGNTGSGKSVLLNILTKNYLSYSGDVFIDSQNIKGIDIKSIQKRVSYADSTPVVFSRSFDENMQMYGGENKENILKAVCDSKVDFIEDESLILKNRGNTFSGGQRARIALAGMLSKDAGVYIFDNCMTAFDADTENEILDNLEKRKKDSTIILVSQRISSIMRADKIIVLSNGTVEAEGTHEWLLENSKIYCDFASLQGLEGS